MWFRLVDLVMWPVLEVADRVSREVDSWRVMPR
jgi:hypothetical protein